MCLVTMVDEIRRHHILLKFTFRIIDFNSVEVVVLSIF